MSEDRDEHFLRAVDLMHLPIGVYILAPDGRFFECNEGARKILALTGSEPVGARIQDFYAEPARFDELVEAALQAERRDDFEKSVVHLRVAGSDVFVEDYLKPLRDESGAIAGYVGCMVDITSEHQSAQRSDERQQKIEELTFDIGQILHANTSTLLMVNQTLGEAALHCARTTQFRTADLVQAMRRDLAQNPLETRDAT